ncbi:MAG: hypothetical protein QNJ54_26845 [Prochloraceae cyanobacterium]|nr:hypothetical protein [Prochloraceae cyanobacterium]
MSKIRDELNSISRQIERIRNSGEVAAPNTWIQKFSVPHNGKRYEYYRLMKASERKSITGKIQGKIEKHLGKLGSKSYLRYREAIDRRNQIQKLEKIQQKLLAIVEEEETIGITRAQSDNEALKPEIPELKILSEKISHLAHALESMEKNHSLLWKWLVVVGEKVGVVIESPSSKNLVGDENSEREIY